MAIRPRLIREFDFLPELSLDNITPENARLDKIRIVYKPAVLSDLEAGEEANGFLAALTPRPPILSSGSHEFKSRRHLVRGYGVTEKRDGVLRRVEVDISMNQTRFLQCRLPDEIPETVSESEAIRLLTIDDSKLQFAKSNTLDGKDNILVGRNWLRGTNPAMQASRMFGLVTGIFHNRFQRVREAEFHWSDFYIGHAEVYWDFQCENAVREVQALARKMKRRADYFSITQYYRNNGISLSTPLMDSDTPQGKVDLKIYAKTQRRIRMEIVYRKSLRGILKNHPNVRSRRPLTEEQLLNAAVDDATVRLRRALQSVTMMRNRRKQHATKLIELMSHLDAACAGNTHAKQSILSALMDSDRFVAFYPPHLPIAEQLVRLKVFERRTGNALIKKQTKNPTYCLRLRYRELFAKLQ